MIVGRLLGGRGWGAAARALAASVVWAARGRLTVSGKRRRVLGCGSQTAAWAADAFPLRASCFRVRCVAYGALAMKGIGVRRPLLFFAGGFPAPEKCLQLSHARDFLNICVA